MLVIRLQVISNKSIIEKKESDYMAERRLQKVFYYSNKSTKMIIEGLLEDEAKVTNRSSSYLIEQHIIREFLPADETIAKWIQNLYLRDETNKSVSNLQNTMVSIFSYLAAGIDGKAKKTNGKILVDFAYQNKCLYQYQLSDYNMEELPYYRNQLRYVCEKIEMLQKNMLDETVEEKEKKAKLYVDIRELKRIQEETEITDDSLLFIYMVIIDNWDMLYNWTYTYRLLVAMARIQTWEESSEIRLNLVRILNDFARNLCERELL
jgi:hypothetical protein